MSNKNILDFVAALATNQPAQAVEFAQAEMRERVQAKVTAYGQAYRYNVEGPSNDGTSD